MKFNHYYLHLQNRDSTYDMKEVAAKRALGSPITGRGDRATLLR